MAASALVAKGAKKTHLQLSPVLLGLQPLRLSYTLAGSSSADIHTLRGAEWAGGHIMPMGARLLSGLYINELLLRLLARDDPYAYVFDVYAALIKLLATQHDVVQEPALRAFELILLRELGLLPSLRRANPNPAAPGTPGPLRPGPRSGPAPRRTGRTGRADRPAVAAPWKPPCAKSRTALPILQACAHLAPALKPQLRTLLQFHCGSPMLRTRQLMMDLQAL